MPSIPFSELAGRFIATLERFSAGVIVESENLRAKPARVRVNVGGLSTNCLVFLWTITPGGGPPGTRPKDERRIQITAAKQFPLRPGCRTLIGGWSPEHEVYAFWDVKRHSRYSEHSPSFQVNARTLETAGAVGLATQFRPTRQGREVIVAVAPDSLLWYVQHGESLHDAEEDAPHIGELLESTPEEQNEFVESSVSEVEANRRIQIVTTLRSYRDSKFRPAVLQAYSYRCAVCGCALKLVDAAHIVPVTYPQSTDEVTNGLALCRLHHGAYDNGLLGVRSDYGVIVNPEMANRLAELQLAIELEEFRARLPAHITCPVSIEARPEPVKLIIGLRARRWPNELVA